MAANLCELASTLPRLIGTLLDREAKLKKGRFREETLTDVLTASLAAFAGPELVIEYPDEVATGGDLDLEFWHAASRRRTLIRVQAKRLNASTNNGKAVAIAHRSYRELLHKVPKTAEYQYKTLLAEAGAHLPLYMFYNHRSASMDPHFNGTHPEVTGVNLAFAHDIANELQLKLDAEGEVPRRRLHHKRLSHLQPHLFGLDLLLCAGTEPGGFVPTPDAVRERLAEEWRRIQRDDDRLVPAGLRRLAEPTQVATYSDAQRRLPDGPAVRFGANVPRTTLTFISGRTDDERTPQIYEGHGASAAASRRRS
ncbi:DUF6615 family protein [Sphingomonas sp. BK580]|uniref:DUF6615 family protein n=1 Tax=Sphingomonas sp. BK580 TaxID=2586972 RepID=UPI0016112B38|nr:DUF6615 family protein [Sphingomonas sp. BK580]MBB3694875.1 hypothetical protein [Sphingomonas sp. BK580]